MIPRPSYPLRSFQQAREYMHSFQQAVGEFCSTKEIMNSIVIERRVPRPEMTARKKGCPPLSQLINVGSQFFLMLLRERTAPGICKQRRRSPAHLSLSDDDDELVRFSSDCCPLRWALSSSPRSAPQRRRRAMWSPAVVPCMQGHPPRVLHHF